MNKRHFVKSFAGCAAALSILLVASKAKVPIVRLSGHGNAISHLHKCSSEVIANGIIEEGNNPEEVLLREHAELLQHYLELCGGGNPVTSHGVNEHGELVEIVTISDQFNIRLKIPEISSDRRKTKHHEETPYRNDCSRSHRAPFGVRRSQYVHRNR